MEIIQKIKDNFANIDALIIAGPTASGKSAFAEKILEKLHKENMKCMIVNIDSKQVYNVLHSVTAQPAKNSSYFLYDYKKPTDKMSAQIWLDDYQQLIKEKRNIFPILVGGTGLYIQAATQGLSLLQPNLLESDLSNIEKKYIDISLEECISLLSQKDINALKYIKDKRRIVRALSILEATGIKYEERKFYNSKPIIKNAVQIYIDSNTLSNNIEQRLYENIDFMIDDVKKCFYAIKNTSLLSIIGVREIYEYLQDNISKTVLVEKIYHKTWQYAKRQRTWFKKYFKEDYFYTNK